jgi:hypothetical protein
VGMQYTEIAQQLSEINNKLCDKVYHGLSSDDCIDLLIQKCRLLEEYNKFQDGLIADSLMGNKE